MKTGSREGGGIWDGRKRGKSRSKPARVCGRRLGIFDRARDYITIEVLPTTMATDDDEAIVPSSGILCFSPNTSRRLRLSVPPISELLFDSHSEGAFLTASLPHCISSSDVGADDIRARAISRQPNPTAI